MITMETKVLIEESGDEPELHVHVHCTCSYNVHVSYQIHMLPDKSYLAM